MKKRNHVQQIGIYALSIVLTASVTMVTIPIIVTRFGPNGWGSIALGQAIGTGCGVLVGFGWGTTGPTQIAASDPAQRIQIYIHSIRARLLLAGPVCALAVGLALVIASSHQTEAWMSAAAFTATGLTAGWYFTGGSDARSFLLFETVPKIVGSAIGASALFVGADLVVFPLLQLVGIVFGLVFSTAKVCGLNASLWRGYSLRATVWQLRNQSHGMVISGATAVSISVPVSIVAAFAPATLPVFAIADKLLRFSTTASGPIIQFLQSWVPGPVKHVVFRRSGIAFWIGITLSSLFGAGFIVICPWFSSILSANSIIPSARVSFAFGLILAFLIMQQVSGLVCLLALGRGSGLARFTLFGTLVSVPAVAVGALTAGAEGAAWGLVASELVTLVPQVFLLATLLKGRSSISPSVGTL